MNRRLAIQGSALTLDQCSIKTPIEIVTNDQITGVIRKMINIWAEQDQEEQVTLPMNKTQLAQPNVIGVSIPSSVREAELQRRLNEMEYLIRRIPGMLVSINKSFFNSYANSLFTDNIALVEMPQKFSFSNIKLYDGTTDPDDHIAQYKQRMFTTAF